VVVVVEEEEEEDRYNVRRAVPRRMRCGGDGYIEKITTRTGGRGERGRRDAATCARVKSPTYIYIYIRFSVLSPPLSPPLTLRNEFLVRVFVAVE